MYQYGGFLRHAGSPKSPLYFRVFPYKPSINWDSPATYYHCKNDMLHDWDTSIWHLGISIRKKPWKKHHPFPCTCFNMLSHHLQASFNICQHFPILYQHLPNMYQHLPTFTNHWPTVSNIYQPCTNSCQHLPTIDQQLATFTNHVPTVANIYQPLTNS